MFVVVGLGPCGWILVPFSTQKMDRPPTILTQSLNFAGIR